MRTIHPRGRRNMRQRENASRCIRKTATTDRRLRCGGRRRSVSRKTPLQALSCLCVTQSEPERQLPNSLLLGHDSAVLCKSPSMYVVEARKQDGSLFLPKSPYMLLTGRLHHMLYCSDVTDAVTHDNRCSCMLSVMFFFHSEI